MSTFLRKLCSFVSISLTVFSCVFFFSVKYVAKLEDGTVVGKSDGVEFTVKDG